MTDREFLLEVLTGWPIEAEFKLDQLGALIEWPARIYIGGKTPPVERVCRVWFDFGFGIRVQIHIRDGAGWVVHGTFLPDDSIPEAHEPCWWSQINVERFIAHRLGRDIL